MQTLRVRSHCTIFSYCNCYLFLLIMGYIGIGDVAAIARCEHFHWVLCNPFVAIRRIAVAIRKIAQCEHFHWILYNPFVAIRRIAVVIRKKRTVWTGLYACIRNNFFWTIAIANRVNWVALYPMGALKARSHCAICDCDLFLPHNELHRSWWCCRSRIVWTLPLSPEQPICCDKRNRSRN